MWTMECKGMVTVVRALPDAGLCVTLHDGTKQFTLAPNTVVSPTFPKKAVYQQLPTQVYQQNQMNPQMYQPNQMYQQPNQLSQPQQMQMSQGQMTQQYGQMPLQYGQMPQMNQISQMNQMPQMQQISQMIPQVGQMTPQVGQMTPQVGQMAQQVGQMAPQVSQMEQVGQMAQQAAHMYSSMYGNPCQGYGQMPAQYPMIQNTKTTGSDANNKLLRNSSSQAVDGRYTSTYMTAHCHQMPTSPNLEISEFPPQKDVVPRGQENFVIGCGAPPRRTGTHKILRQRAERGVVSPTRHSAEPDPFADSLRKYPSANMAEKCSEVMERLINYTHNTHDKSNCKLRKQVIPSRSDSVNLEADRSSKSSCSRLKCYEPEIFIKPRVTTYDDTPSYDKARKCDIEAEYRRMGYGKNSDVRFIRELNSMKECISYIPAQSYSQPTCPLSRDACDGHHTHHKRRQTYSASRVDTQTQAAIEMVSREVSTVPRLPPPELRNVNVAVDLTKIFAQTQNNQRHTSIQTIKLSDIIIKIRKSVQTCISNVEFTDKNNINERKTISHYELRINSLENEVLRLIQNLGTVKKDDLGKVKDDIIVKLRKLHETDVYERVRLKFDDVLTNNNELDGLINRISNELVAKIKQRNFSVALVANTNKNNEIEDSSTEIELVDIETNDVQIETLVRNWVKRVALKNKVCLSNSSFFDLVKRVRNVIDRSNDEAVLKERLLYIIANLMMYTKNDIEKLQNYRLVTELIENLNEINYFSTNDMKTESFETEEVSVEDFIKNELAFFMENFDINICNESLSEITVRLTDLISSVEEFDKVKLKNEIMHVLLNVLIVTEDQVNFFADNLINNLKFNDNIQESYMNKSQTFVILPSTTCTEIQKPVPDTPEVPDAKLNEIAEQIKLWIDNIGGIDSNEEHTVALVNDLAADILDRHKYQKLNPENKSTYKEELKYLKYQLYRWYNRLVGVENIELTDHASDLMKRIQDVLNENDHCSEQCGSNKNPDHSNTYALVEYDKSIESKREIKEHVKPIKPSLKPTKNNKTYTSMTDFDRCCKTKDKRLSGSSRVSMSKEPRPILKEAQSCCKENKREEGPKCCAPEVDKARLHEEYDQFLTNWTQELPINEDEALANTLRLGMFNGIKEIMAKINMNPEAVLNPYYYKDLMDDEVEELMSCLPQNPDLAAKKDELKARVVERSQQLVDVLFKQSIAASYKQQLVDSLTSSIPSGNKVRSCEADTAAYAEEIMKLQIAEDFIMLTKFKDDKIKSNIYKKKLLREIDDMMNAYSQFYGKPISKVERHLYIDNLMKKMDSVPVPTNETINREVEEILLWTEVEQWSSDLPFLPADRDTDQIMRIKQRDVLSKKLYDLESVTGNIADKENEAKGEIISYLRKMPLGMEGLDNENFMAEELINRLKNRNKDVIATDKTRKRSIGFVEPYDYDEFSHEMPLCSSFDEESGKKAQVNEGSYMIVGGERVDNYNPSLGPYVQGRGESMQSHEWLTLQESGASQVKPCCNMPRQPIIPKPPDQPQRDESSEKWLTLEETQAPQALRSYKDPNNQSFQKQSCCKEPRSISEPPQEAPKSVLANRSCPRAATQPAAQKCCDKSVEKLYSTDVAIPPDFEGTQKRSTCVYKDCATCTDVGSKSFRSQEYQKCCDASAGPSTGRELNSQSSTRCGKECSINSPQDFSRAPPLGFSTPQQKSIKPSADARPKKKPREVERSRKDAAKKRLDLDDSSESDDDEDRKDDKCKCLAQLMKCRRKMMPQCDPCDNYMDFMPYFPMAYPRYPYFF